MPHTGLRVVGSHGIRFVMPTADERFARSIVKAMNACACTAIA
ncbi:hypothetical protein [Cryobacterium sp. Y57]|nr:hypothetical protein [Cryobacterium sp. Y57]